MAIRSRNRIDPAFSMSSMTDIVFLLLIFFIVLSTLVSPYGVKVDPPSSDMRTTEKPEYVVTIDKELQYYFNEDISSPEAVTEKLKELLKPEGEKNIVALKVDKDVPSGETIYFFTELKKLGYTVLIPTKNK